MDDELAERLADRALESERLQPSVGAAQAEVALADLVAVQDQDAGPGAGQLAGRRKPREAGAAEITSSWSSSVVRSPPRLVRRLGILAGAYQRARADVGPAGDLPL